MKFLIDSVFSSIWYLFIAPALFIGFLLLIIISHQKLPVVGLIIVFAVPCLLYWLFYKFVTRNLPDFEDERYTKYWLTLNKHNK